jgi:2-polyprenyl-6-methoxyphenol hydroxylase-like FAD-dependent oxidoreductase
MTDGVGVGLTCGMSQWPPDGCVESRFRAVVVGGSLGGLAAAHELRAIGAHVAVYERSAQQMHARGAGIVMQPEVEALLARAGFSAQSVSVALTHRQELRTDAAPRTHAAPQLMTSWDTLYTALREPLADVCYRSDSSLSALMIRNGLVYAEFADGYVASGDFAVAADGVNSTARVLLGAGAGAVYSGYVAWRGLRHESELPGDLVELLAERFTYFARPGMQMLCYLVPGENRQQNAGSRRVNWVWYVNTAYQAVLELLRGRSSFLPPGELETAAEHRLRDMASRWLPLPFARLVQLSEVFMQPVLDLAPTHMLAERSALIGDAAGTVRPHTASGTSKAFGDAAELAQALAGWRSGDDLPVQRLQSWEHRRLRQLMSVANMGTQLAHRSGLGTRGAPVFWAA